MKSLRLILSNPRYFAPSWVFASINILFGTWAIYIPAVKEKLGINKADLGIALFFLSLGVFIVFPVAAKIINRLGVGRATWYGIICSSLAALFPLLAPNYYSLMGGLFLLGAGNGFTDIAMNTLVTEIEKEDRQNFMSASHGFFSLGGVIAGLGSFLIFTINNPALHMLYAVILVLLINFIFHRHYIHIIASPVEKEPFSLKLFRPLLVLGIISFVVMGGEGAIVDWSGLFLQEISMAPESLIGTGFLAFSVMMTLGRFLGDSISAAIGPVKIVALGASIAIVGFVFVLTTYIYMAILGFALIGLGFSVIVPELFRIGGTVKGVDSSQGVSFIAGTGYSGFLIGPVVLGFVAESYSLKYTFIILLLCTIIVLMAILRMHRKKG
ncbi:MULTISPECIES: MFS transporter [unclassified Arenibacter]|uniref:MFS transporter n=1 Tax=unclassified Arenibacter TaxID=2615047 RepID=UPI000E341E97|nr:MULTISPECIES: MFS transporter [unclassified Arenibacter]MCM4164173.1 MFS transporter [Arenibacter sp. A80]RFT55971.1 MFS transporter [Arenibacter sp. P308M17]